VAEVEGALVPDTATTQVFHGASTQVFQRATRVFAPPLPPGPKPVVQTSPLLPLVACERVARGLLLLGIGAAALLLRNRPDLSIRDTTVRLDMSLNPAQHAYDRLATPVGHVTAHDLAVLAIVAFALGGLYFVEAIGLAARLRAVVYLTIATTLALIPFELWEIMRSPARVKEIALALNVAVAVLLLWTLARERFGAGHAPHAAATRASV
jgi:uncharacterized membrane protein (DUF2068 family)